MTKILRIVQSGDSFPACSGCYPFLYWGVTSYSDCGKPDWQSGTTYYPAANVIFRNMGVSGTRLNTNGYPDTEPLAPVKIDPIARYKAPNSLYAYTCGISYNDRAIDGYATADLFAIAVGQHCLARKNAGFDITTMTEILPGDGIDEVKRALYNATINDVGFKATYKVDFVIPFTSEATMNNVATLDDPTYYVARVHPAAAGHALLVVPYASVHDQIRAML